MLAKDIKPEDIEILKMFEAWLKKVKSVCNDCGYEDTSVLTVCPMCSCTDIYTK